MAHKSKIDKFLSDGGTDESDQEPITPSIRSLAGRHRGFLGCRCFCPPVCPPIVLNDVRCGSSSHHALRVAGEGAAAAPRRGLQRQGLVSLLCWTWKRKKAVIRVQSWRRRYFVSREGSTLLEYHKSDASEARGDAPKGMINMSMCTAIKEVADHPKYDFLLGIYTKLRNYYVAAESRVCRL